LGRYSPQSRTAPPVARHRRLDPARLFVAVIARQAARDILQRQFRQDRHPVEALLPMGFDVVAAILERLAREGLVDRLDLLQSATSLMLNGNPHGHPPRHSAKKFLLAGGRRSAKPYTPSNLMLKVDAQLVIRIKASERDRFVALCDELDTSAARGGSSVDSSEHGDTD
jgi:hypothetical protein